MNQVEHKTHSTKEHKRQYQPSKPNHEHSFTQDYFGLAT